MEDVAAAVASAVVAVSTTGPSSASKSNAQLTTLAMSPHGQSRVLRFHQQFLALASSYLDSKPGNSTIRLTARHR